MQSLNLGLQSLNHSDLSLKIKTGAKMYICSGRGDNELSSADRVMTIGCRLGVGISFTDVRH